MFNVKIAKVLGILGLTAVGFAATAKGSSLVRLGKQLVIDTDTDVEIKRATMTIIAKARLKNPTGESISFFHPFVKIQFEENAPEPLTSSDPKPKVYELQPHDTLELDPIVMRLGIVDVIRAVPQIISQIKNKKGLTVFVMYVISITNKSIPMDKMDKYTIPFGKLDEFLDSIVS